MAKDWVRLDGRAKVMARGRVRLEARLRLWLEVGLG